MALITPAEAAKRLGVTGVRVRVLIRTGRLPAQQYGRMYLINEKDLKLVKNRKPGRPKQTRK